MRPAALFSATGGPRIFRCAAVLVAVAALCLSVAPVSAGPKLVFDIRTGAVLHAQDADDPWYPASVTKLMTTYVALKAVEAGELGLETMLVASSVAVAQPPSKIGIVRGQTISLENALRLLIVKSANDIAVVVAEGISGSVPAFAERMTQTARDLGMSRTRFVNPHGLPDADQVTTARDMAILTRALSLEFPESARLTRLPYVKIGQNTIRSHNALIGRYSGADGMKTGFICAAGFNIIASSTRRGQRIAAVVFGELSPDERRITTERLLDLGFSHPRFELQDRPTLRTLARSGSADQPVNMRPKVCGEGRVPRSGIPGLKEFNYGGPEVSVAFGPVLEIAPLPLPRPADLTPAADDKTIELASAEAGDDSTAAEPATASRPAIPLPPRRPVQVN